MRKKYFDELNLFWFYKFKSEKDFEGFVKLLRYIIRLRHRGKKQLACNYLQNLGEEAGFVIRNHQRWHPNRRK